jgi:hypothetical protein
MARQPITGRACWTGKELDASGDWIHHFSQAHLDEIDQALARPQAPRNPALQVRSRGLPLPGCTAPFLAMISDELENGRGAVRLRGIDAARYSDDDLRRDLLGIGRHLGTAIYQNARGEIMGEVRDETKLATAARTFDETKEGDVAFRPRPLPLHRPAALAHRPLRRHRPPLRPQRPRGRRTASSPPSPPSTTKSSAAAPDLLEELYNDYWRMRPADEDGVSPETSSPSLSSACATARSPANIPAPTSQQAQQVARVPRLTAAQNEALDLLAEVAEELCAHSPFVPGDIQALNNHVIYHGRTGYADDSATHQERLLFRLWLAVPNSRALPEGFDNLRAASPPAPCAVASSQPETGLRIPGLTCGVQLVSYS